MNLSELSLRRPVLAMVCSIVIIIFGAIGYSFLGVREYPAIDPSVINVRTSYVGANADIIEQHIRFEERVLFAHLQHHLREAELSGIASQMNALHPNQVEEDWKDAFWIRKKNR